MDYNTWTQGTFKDYLHGVAAVLEVDLEGNSGVCTLGVRFAATGPQAQVRRLNQLPNPIEIPLDGDHHVVLSTLDADRGAPRLRQISWNPNNTSSK